MASNCEEVYNPRRFARNKESVCVREKETLRVAADGLACCECKYFHGNERSETIKDQDLNWYLPVKGKRGDQVQFFGSWISEWI